MVAEHVDSYARRVQGKPKFKYLLPLDDEIAERVNLLAKACPQVRATSETATRLESIQERAGQHGPWRSSHCARLVRWRNQINPGIAASFSAAQIVYLLRTLHRLAVFCEVGIKLFAVLHVLNFISNFAARFYFLYARAVTLTFQKTVAVFRHVRK